MMSAVRMSPYISPYLPLENTSIDNFAMLSQTSELTVLIFLFPAWECNRAICIQKDEGAWEVRSLFQASVLLAHL